MKLFVPPIDYSQVNTIIYHLQDAPSLSMKLNGLEEFIDFDLELGHVCDTSEIDGNVHFFPKGYA